MSKKIEHSEFIRYTLLYFIRFSLLKGLVANLRKVNVNHQVWVNYFRCTRLVVYFIISVRSARKEVRSSNYLPKIKIITKLGVRHWHFYWLVFQLV